MLYALDVGAFEQTLIRQATAAGQPIPDRVANAPRLQPGLELTLMPSLTLIRSVHTVFLCRLYHGVLYFLMGRLTDLTKSNKTT